MSSVSRQPADGHVEGRGGLRAAVSRSALRLQSDRRLVALTRTGSGTAFAVIVERYRAPLLTYTRRLLGPDEAEDALQQTFANALGALRRDDRAIQLRPWLYRIAHNVAVNALRRGGRHHEQLDEQFDGVPQPPDMLDEKLRVERLIEGIVQLPDRQREAIVAHELEGRSYEEIAHSMSATTPIVRQLVHRARTRLRDACGVLVPAGALRWLLVADLRTPGSERVGEAVAGGAGGAGLLKAGTALLATGAIATGAGGLVIEHDRQPARGHQASADTQSNAAQASPQHGSGTLQTPAPGRHPQVKREGRNTPGDNGGDRSGERAPRPDRRGGDRGDSQPPHRNHDDRASDDGSDDSTSDDTHQASHEASDDPHDGSRGSGSPDGDGSGDSSGSSAGSDSHEGSSSPDSPPVETTEP